MLKNSELWKEAFQAGSRTARLWGRKVNSALEYLLCTGLGLKVTTHRMAGQEESTLHVFIPLGERHWVRNRHPGPEQH